VYPDLVTRTATGEVQRVKYQELIPMLLNELQREHHARQQESAKVAALEAKVGRVGGARSGAIGTDRRSGWARRIHALNSRMLLIPAPSYSLAHAAWIPRLTIWRDDGTMQRREGEPCERWASKRVARDPGPRGPGKGERAYVNRPKGASWPARRLLVRTLEKLKPFPQAEHG
jgi:hypothetical protein